MFAEDITRALPELRGHAEARMVDLFEAYALTNAKVDGLDEEVRTSQGVTIGRLTGGRSSDTNTRSVTVGDVERPVVEGGLHIPLDAPLPAIGWEYECVEVGPASDPSLLGRKWRVVDVPAKSHATARRLDVVEV